MTAVSFAIAGNFFAKPGWSTLSFWRAAPLSVQIFYLQLICWASHHACVAHGSDGENTVPILSISLLPVLSYLILLLFLTFKFDIELVNFSISSFLI